MHWRAELRLKSVCFFSAFNLRARLKKMSARTPKLKTEEKTSPFSVHVYACIFICAKKNAYNCSPIFSHAQETRNVGAFSLIRCFLLSTSFNCCFGKKKRIEIYKFCKNWRKDGSRSLVLSPRPTARGSKLKRKTSNALIWFKKIIIIVIIIILTTGNAFN